VFEAVPLTSLVKRIGGYEHASNQEDAMNAVKSSLQKNKAMYWLKHQG
jgi:hypothetical protein